MTAKFKLSEGEQQMALWIRYRKFLDERLAELRAKNDRAQSPEDTAWTRGQIAELKYMLGLDSDRQN